MSNLVQMQPGMDGNPIMMGPSHAGMHKLPSDAALLIHLHSMMASICDEKDVNQSSGNAKRNQLVDVNDPVHRQGINGPNLDIGGAFTYMIMECINQATQAQQNKTAADANLSQILSEGENAYMNQLSQDLQDIYDHQIVPAQNAINAESDDSSGSDMQKQSSKLSVAQNAYQLKQTQGQGMEQEQRAIVESATTTTSTDNNNMNNFIQFAASAVQLLGLGVTITQRQMG